MIHIYIDVIYGYTGPGTPFGGESVELGEKVTVQSHEMRLHEINTLEWEDLVVSNDPNNLIIPGKGTTMSLIFLFVETFGSWNLLTMRCLLQTTFHVLSNKFNLKHMIPEIM